MTRPMVRFLARLPVARLAAPGARPDRSLGLLAGMALAGLAACAPAGRDPAIGPVATAPRPAAAAPAAGATTVAPPPSPAVRDQAAIAAACRRDADRIVTMRDRGQLMREDERDARIGSEASIFSRRAETDRLGRIFERDRLADQCVQENTRAAPQR